MSGDGLGVFFMLVSSPYDSVKKVIRKQIDANNERQRKGNPSPASQWRSTTNAAQIITVAISSVEPVDYVGIARHNPGSDGAEIKFEGRTADNPTVLTELFSGAVLPDNRSVILRFDPVTVTEIIIRTVPVEDLTRIGILYVGKLTVMQMKELLRGRIKLYLLLVLALQSLRLIVPKLRPTALICRSPIWPVMTLRP